jgi:transcriptional regulator with XRE-family HTH domain
MTTYGERLDKALATEIRVQLAERNLEQKDLADQVGINRVTMSHYMTTKRSMPMPTFVKVAEVLGLTPSALMARAEARIQPEEQTA